MRLACPSSSLGLEDMRLPSSDTEPIRIGTFLEISVARNEEVIPRGTYEECVISTGDRIEIVHRTAGGRNESGLRDMILPQCWPMRSQPRILRCLQCLSVAKSPARRSLVNHSGTRFGRVSGQFFQILPGCFSAREAVKTACMGRELFETNFV